MTNLTEQYRKGELPVGTYYVKYIWNDIPLVDIYRRIYSLKKESELRFTINQIAEVLEEVPTNDEWLTAKKMIAQSIGVCDENSKLKELLKRCKRIIEIDESVSITGAGRDILWDLLQDLKQVLGEE